MCRLGTRLSPPSRTGPHVPRGWLGLLSGGWIGQVASLGWQGVVTSHLASSILPAFLSRLERGCWGLNLGL